MTKQNNDGTDICSSIYSPDTVDPFEGLDLDDICVKPELLKKGQPSTENVTGKDADLFGLNPIDDTDLQGLSVAPETIASATVSHSVKKQGEISGPSSANSTHRTADLPQVPIHPIIEKAYHFAELNQIRQKVFAGLEKKNGRSILLASPHDNTGSSLLAAALGYNIACSSQKSVLLIDCNMRRAGLHEFFFLPQSYGFTDLIRDNLPWQAVVKDTGINGLSVITAGDPVEHFSDYLRYSHVPNLVKDIRDEYDLILFETSPILHPNRNNVNIVSLTAATDYFLLVTKQIGTTKDHLKEAKDIIEAGNGKIDGIVVNEHSPKAKPVPYKN